MARLQSCIWAGKTASVLKPIIDGSQGKTTADYFGNRFFHIAHIGIFIIA